MEDYATDPRTGGALAGAVDWLCTALMGSVGTTIAILAVAMIGLLMLQGRLPVRRGATVILGCFILFRASSIADGIMVRTGQADAMPVASVIVPPTMYQPTSAKVVPYDPYAGASVPIPQSNDLIH